jgi:hypothetical protein
MENLPRKFGGNCEGRIMAITRLRGQAELNRQVVAAPRMPLLKKLFWAYFLLLFFEGAIRKWILPQYAGPLLLVRDPIAFLIIWEAYRSRKWPREWSSAIGFLTVGMMILCIVQLIIGEAPWFVIVYGLRSYLLPFPVALIMGENLDSEDLRKFAVCTLWLLPPLTGLEIAQYYAPTSSFLNGSAVVGGEQLAYSAGHIRASATFSYVTGPMNYLPLAAAFIFWSLANPGLVKRWTLWAAAAALILAIPVTGSRTAVYELAAVVACVGIAAMFGVSQFMKSLQMILVMAFVALLVSRLPFFSEASSTLDQRFYEADAYEGGSTEQSLLVRIVRPMIWAVGSNVADNNLVGVGMGYGASAIAKLLTGQLNGLAGEGELDRVMFEFGWPCGFVFMMFRGGLAFMIISKAIGRARHGQPLALLLVPLTFTSLMLGVLEQPTIQGFMVISVAFSLAALRPAPQTALIPALPGTMRRSQLRNASGRPRAAFSRNVEPLG